MDIAIYSQNTVDEQASEIIPDLALKNQVNPKSMQLHSLPTATG